MTFHPQPTSRRARPGFLLGALAVSTVALAGCNAAIAGGTVAAIAVIAFVGYGCGEPVDVTVWDRKTAHPICDATVTAEQDGTVHEFSPCYRLHLGDGVWRVKASKPGYVPAVGVVTVNKERRCSQPTFHTVALTLVPEGERAPAPPPPAAPAAQPPPAESAAPSSPAAPPAPASPPPGTVPAAGGPTSTTTPPPAFPVTPAPASS